MTTATIPRPIGFTRKSPINKGKWVLVSVGLHALALVGIALYSPRPLPLASYIDETVVWLDIEPLVVPNAAPQRASAPNTDAADSLNASQNQASRQSSQAPSPPVPRRVQALPPAEVSEVPSSQPTQSPDRWTYIAPPQSQAPAIGRDATPSFTTCAYPQRLSERQRQLCDERAGARASNSQDNARIAGSGNSRRDSAFDAAHDKRMVEREWKRSTVTAAEVGNESAGDTPGSNFGIGRSGRHLDPSLQPDAYGPLRTYRREGRPQVQQPPRDR